MIQKLDYLNDGDPNTDDDLGVTGIWLMPVSESPSYHGYDVVDYRSIDQEYGTMEDFEEFLDEAHKRGIKVIIDFVINHSSSQHPWFLSAGNNPSSPYRDWYRWEDEDPGYTGPWGQPVWHFKNGYYYFGLFWSGMPDLNYENEEVKDEMFDAARFWLEDVGVDGFRCDAIKHLFEDGPVMENVPANFPFLEEFHDFYKNVNPEALAVGEVWSNTTDVLLYVDDKMDICFEFDLASATIASVDDGNPDWVKGVAEFAISNYPPNQFATFLTNHDQNRVFEVLGQNESKMKLAAAIYLTLPGTPFLYYGEEVGMIGSGPDENKRKPMQWTDGPGAGFTTGNPWYPLNANYTSYNLADMQAEAGSLWHYYRTLIAHRNREAPLRTGEYLAMQSGNNQVWAYGRQQDGELLVIVHNFSGTEVSDYSLWLASSDLAEGEFPAVDLMSGSSAQVSITASGGFEDWIPVDNLGPRQTAIFKLGTATSAGQPSPAEELMVFPNPAKERLWVKLMANEGISKVKVMDLKGRVWLEKEEANRPQFSLPLESLPAGTYILEVSASDGKTITHKLIKQ